MGNTRSAIYLSNTGRGMRVPPIFADAAVVGTLPAPAPAPVLDSTFDAMTDAHIHVAQARLLDQLGYTALADDARQTAGRLVRHIAAQTASPVVPTYLLGEDALVQAWHIGQLQRGMVAAQLKANPHAYVLQKPCAPAEVMGAEHPVLGTVYWAYSDVGSSHAPEDRHGLTDLIEHATHFALGWQQDYCASLRWQGYAYRVTHRTLRSLARKAQQSYAAFSDWFGRANWTPRIAPPAVCYLESFADGKLQWTQNIWHALALPLADIDELFTDSDREILRVPLAIALTRR